MNSKIFLNIIFFILLQINIAYSNDKIFFIDLDYLINNSNFSKKIFQEIKIKIEEYNKILNIDENKLRDEDLNLSQKKNILSDEEFNKQLKDLREKIDNFNSKKEKISLEIEKLKQEKVNLIINKINPIIEQYTEEKDLDMILTKKSIYISKNKFDLTNEILKTINERIN